jgi:hypothetical protein
LVPPVFGAARILNRNERAKAIPIYTIDAFFDAEGRNKRATEEIQEAEAISTKRALARRKGGIRSGVSKAVAIGKQMLQHEESKSVALAVAKDQQNRGICEAIQNQNIKTSTGRVERGDKPKPPNLTTRGELEALIAARRQGRTA